MSVPLVRTLRPQTSLERPVPMEDQVPPPAGDQRAMLEAGVPPPDQAEQAADDDAAVVHGEKGADACVDTLAGDARSGCQSAVLPSKRAMRVTVVPPEVVKMPPATTSPLGRMARAFDLVVHAVAEGDPGGAVSTSDAVGGAAAGDGEEAGGDDLVVGLEWRGQRRCC